MTNFESQDPAESNKKSGALGATELGIDMSREQVPGTINSFSKPTGNYWLDAIYRRELDKNHENSTEIQGWTDAAKKLANSAFPQPGSQKAKDKGLVGPEYTQTQAARLQELRARSGEGTNLPGGIGFSGERLSPKEQAELSAWQNISGNKNTRESLQRALEQVFLYTKKDQPLEVEMRDNPVAGGGNAGLSFRESKLQYGEALTAEEKLKWQHPLTVDQEQAVLGALIKARPDMASRLSEKSGESSLYGFYDSRLDHIIALIPSRRGYKY